MEREDTKTRFTRTLIMALPRNGPMTRFAKKPAPENRNGLS